MWSRGRFLFIGALLVALVCVGVMIVSLRIRHRNAEEARNSRLLLSHAVKLDVEAFFGERAKALALISALLRDGLIRSQGDFEYYSRQVFTQPAIFRRISFANPTYELIYQHPVVHLQHNLRSFPDRYAFAENARLTGRMTVTDPVHLVPDGRLAFAVYSPVFRQNEFIGIVIGLVDVADFVEKRLAPAFRGAPFRILGASGRPVYSSASAQRPFQRQLALRVALGDNAWLIDAGMPPALQRDGAVGHELMLVGLVMATAIGLALLYLIQANQLEKARRNLVEASRMAALGELSAAIAHEIRNPLSSVASSIAALKRSYPAGGEDAALLGLCTKEVFRLDQIVSDFLTFARPRRPATERVALNGLLYEVATAFGKDERWRGRIQVIRPERGLGPVIEADRNMLLQLLWNLLINGAQSIPEEGRIVMDCGVRDGEAWVSVSDTGAGIPPALRPRIFEPFFTTKASGLGLGLSIVKKIVNDHGGSLGFSSREGEGTEIRLTFPLAGQEVAYGSVASAR